MSTNLESLRHYRCVTDSASEQDLVADGAKQALSEEDLIRRLARDRREGRDTTHDLRERGYPLRGAETAGGGRR